MKRHAKLLLAGLAALALGGAVGGCIGFGPIDDRLYVKEWKENRELPIVQSASEGWEYRGEWWERRAWSD